MNREDALCLAAIFVITTLFLFPALRPGYTLLPLGVESGIAPWHKQVTQLAKNLLLSDPLFYLFSTTPFLHGSATVRHLSSVEPLCF